MNAKITNGVIHFLSFSLSLECKYAFVVELIGRIYDPSAVHNPNTYTQNNVLKEILDSFEEIDASLVSSSKNGNGNERPTKRNGQSFIIHTFNCLSYPPTLSRSLSLMRSFQLCAPLPETKRRKKLPNTLCIYFDLWIYEYVLCCLNNRIWMTICQFWWFWSNFTQTYINNLAISKIPPSIMWLGLNTLKQLCSSQIIIYCWIVFGYGI